MFGVNVKKEWNRNVKIKELKQTQFKSFEDIFNHYYEITYQTIERFIDFKLETIETQNI
jgi:hypothetical protein